MEKKFAIWLDKFPEFRDSDIRGIFDDAISCYKFAIARPALMLSYVAFLMAIRQNINNSEAPKGYSPSEWSRKKRDLFSDIHWESTVMELILTKGKVVGKDQKEKVAIFNISDQLREDVTYWKNRRNDCAHYRNVSITNSHVEAFWLFIMTNYPRFYLQGSIQTCIDEYIFFFDRSITPEGEDDNLLFDKLTSILTSCEDVGTFLVGIQRLGWPIVSSMCFRLIHNTNDIVRGNTADYIAKTYPLNVNYVNRYEDDAVLIFDRDPKLVRRLWYESTDIHYFCVFLRHSLIPEAQVEEAYNRRFYLIEEADILPAVNEKDANTLNDNGFYDKLYTRLFDQTAFREDYARINLHNDLYCASFMMCTKNDENLKILINCFDQSNSPWSLESSITSLIRRTTELMNWYTDGLNRHIIEDRLYIITHPEHDESFPFPCL